MTIYKARVSFFSSGGRHFNQGEIVDTTTFFNLTSTDQGNILVETVAENGITASVPLGPVYDENLIRDVPLRVSSDLMGHTQPDRPGGDAATAMQESLLAIIERGFEQFGQKVFSELEAIKKALLTLVEGPPKSSEIIPEATEEPEEQAATPLTGEEHAEPSAPTEMPEDKPVAIPTAGEPPTA